jgi:hypothetical protein
VGCSGPPQGRHHVERGVTVSTIIIMNQVMNYNRLLFSGLQSNVRVQSGYSTVTVFGEMRVSERRCRVVPIIFASCSGTSGTLSSLFDAPISFHSTVPPTRPAPTPTHVGSCASTKWPSRSSKVQKSVARSISASCSRGELRTVCIFFALQRSMPSWRALAVE